MRVKKIPVNVKHVELRHVLNQGIVQSKYNTKFSGEKMKVEQNGWMRKKNILHI